MEDKIVRICTLVTFGLLIFVCTSFFYLPSLHTYEESVRQEYLREAAARENITELSGLELLQYNNTVSEIREEEVFFDEQLRIAMPFGHDASEALIVNDPIHKTIELTLPGAEENYMYRYPMLGTPESILDLTYESANDRGTLDITTDKPMEYRRRDGGEYLYLDLITPHEKYDYVIVVDAGHGGPSSGAVREEVLEKDLNLAFSEKAIRALKNRFGDRLGVYYTRNGDENPSFEERVALANESEADLFLSIHNNAAKRNDKASGTTVLYKGAAGLDYDAKALAEIFSEELTAALGSENRGATTGDEIYVIHHSDVPVLLLEIGFMSNHNDLQKLQKEEYQELAAEGICNAVARAAADLEQ